MGAGFVRWEHGWSQEKKNWCCRRTGRACKPFDCHDGLAAHWAESKKVYCCIQEALGCATTTRRLPFDCHFEVNTWDLWSDEKKAYCCNHGGKGCDRYDCDNDLARFQTTWHAERKEWCCMTYGKGCYVQVKDEELLKGGKLEAVMMPSRFSFAMSVSCLTVVAAALVWKHRMSLWGRLTQSSAVYPEHLRHIDDSNE